MCRDVWVGGAGGLEIEGGEGRVHVLVHVWS